MAASVAMIEQMLEPLCWMSSASAPSWMRNADAHRPSVKSLELFHRPPRKKKDPSIWNASLPAICLVAVLWVVAGLTTVLTLNG
jgi:hypothetical protein